MKIAFRSKVFLLAIPKKRKNSESSLLKIFINFGKL
jgi:hypothetical protein